MLRTVVATLLNKKAAVMMKTAANLTKVTTKKSLLKLKPLEPNLGVREEQFSLQFFQQQHVPSPHCPMHQNQQTILSHCLAYLQTDSCFPGNQNFLVLNGVHVPEEDQEEFDDVAENWEDDDCRGDKFFVTNDEGGRQVDYIDKPQKAKKNRLAKK